MDSSMYMVVGFEVTACSIERTPGQAPKDVSCLEFNGDRPPKSQEIKKGGSLPRPLGRRPPLALGHAAPRASSFLGPVSTRRTGGCGAWSERMYGRN